MAIYLAYTVGTKMPITRLGLGFCRGSQLTNGLPHRFVWFYRPDVSEPSLVHAVLGAGRSEPI